MGVCVDVIFHKISTKSKEIPGGALNSIIETDKRSGMGWMISVNRQSEKKKRFKNEEYLLRANRTLIQN